MSSATEKNIQLKNRFFVRGAFRRFFVPAVLSSFWLAAAGFADSIFVGRGIGAAGLAAVILGQPIYLFYNILSYGMSIGGSIHFASKLAEGKEEEGNRIFMNVLQFLLVTYIVTAGLGLIFQPQLMRLLGADPADQITYTFIRTQLMFIPVMFCQGPFYFFVNADNAPRTAAVALSVSGITDAVFSYIFVMRMGLGVAGSVYSTVVGAVLMLLISGSHIVRKQGALRFRLVSVNSRILALSGKTGFATSVQYLFQFITIIAVNRILMKLAGPVSVAAFDVVYNISLLCSSLSEGTAVATEPMLSSYRSERNTSNIHITINLALFWAGVLSAVFAVILFLFSNSFSVFFGMDEGLELLYTSDGIRIFALSVLPAMFNIIFAGYYQSIFREGLTYLITFLRSFVFYLTALFLCSRGGMHTFWYVFLLAEVLSILVWLPAAIASGGILQLKSLDTSAAKTAVIDSSSEDISAVAHAMQTFIEEHGGGMKQVMYVGLTIEEICCAIIERFREQMGDIYIQVTVVAEDGGATLFLRDNAFEFNPMEEDTENIDLDQDKHLDLVGLRIVQKKAKEFYYRRFTGFNTLVIRL